MIQSLFLNKTYSRQELYGLIEAILFVNGKAYDKKDLAALLECSVEDLEHLIEEMNANYKEAKRGLTIIPVAHGYQLVTSPLYHQEMKELFGKRSENKLSPSALEVLAIIAYKQPVSKDEIDRIRGVSSSRSLNLLLTLKLITVSGSSDDVFQNPLYVTTERFLELFRINSLDDLPALSQLEWKEMEGFDEEGFAETEENDEDISGEGENTEKETLF
ncbi:SMC-Scp complex subunit ScpB [Thermospira aquatica]|uniref:SMC-Scp complex subunit ScpB n=1 Tax=Thermospira aquatica TaxID=2828656 RepID=A0AAX3BA85_9SPIR|nr:SMC-Scp complex subunit ScpB [Thermospira aquatica]URA09167.1 SMC-Scp complex subunit ScpB [Thermospira aquatica]